MKQRKVLVLAGGGVRGYSQVQVLKKIEEEKGPLHKYYDLVAGSSVGAINAAMIASGKISMDKLESIYPDMVKKIFKRQMLPPIPFYDRKNFIEIFLNEVGMIKMKDCLTKLQITSVNLCDKRNHFFKSWEPKDGETYLVSNVCKSFAAPLFFSTFIDEENKAVYFDGGMGVANLPLAYAVVEAQLLWPSDSWYFDIIGCGFANENISFDKAKKYRVFRQLGQFFDIDDAGLAREQSRQEQLGAIQRICETNKTICFKYYDSEISKEMDKLDGVKYLDDYKKIGLKMAEKPLIEC